MLYGTTLRLPGEYFSSSNSTIESDFLRNLRQTMSNFKSIATSSHTTEKPFVQKQLKNCTHVFIRNDAVRTPLQPPYDGPYPVLKKYDKYFRIKFNNRIGKISIDRLKAAYIAIDSEYKAVSTDFQPVQPTTTTSTTTVLPTTVSSSSTSTTLPSSPVSTKRVQFQPIVERKSTRSGRIINKPIRYH